MFGRRAPKCAMQMQGTTVSPRARAASTRACPSTISSLSVIRTTWQNPNLSIEAMHFFFCLLLDLLTACFERLRDLIDRFSILRSGSRSFFLFMDTGAAGLLVVVITASWKIVSGKSRWCVDQAETGNTERSSITILTKHRNPRPGTPPRFNYGARFGCSQDIVYHGRQTTKWSKP